MTNHTAEIFKFLYKANDWVTTPDFSSFCEKRKIEPPDLYDIIGEMLDNKYLKKECDMDSHVTGNTFFLLETDCKFRLTIKGIEYYKLNFLRSQSYISRLANMTKKYISKVSIGIAGAVTIYLIKKYIENQ